MIEISPAQRRALRARAHPLHPVVSIGQAGLTPQVLREVDRALAAHELIKVRVLGDDRDAREALLASLCASLGAAPVQHLGKLLIVWRPRPEEPPAKVPSPPRGGRKVRGATAATGRPAAKPRSPGRGRPRPR